MKTVKRLSLALGLGLFLAVSFFWLMASERASATCPDPECSGVCQHVCVWDYSPQSTTAFGTDKKDFSQDMTFEWCLTCPVFYGYAEFDEDNSQNANLDPNVDPVPYPDFFYVNTCSGSVGINISGRLQTACTQPSRVATAGYVADSGYGGECESVKVITINNAPGC